MNNFKTNRFGAEVLAQLNAVAEEKARGSESFRYYNDVAWSEPWMEERKKIRAEEREHERQEFFNWFERTVSKALDDHI